MVARRMSCPTKWAAAVRFLVSGFVAFLVFATELAHSQQDVPPAYVFHANQTVRVRDLRPQVALSTNAAAVLSAAVETIFHDRGVCCGKGSALEDSLLSVDPLSLKDIASKLEGRHLLSDGRPITIAAEYLAPDSINPDQIISPLLKNRALLVTWKSRLYVVYGAVFDEKLYYSGQREYVIHKLLLLDVRFSDSRREVVFDREIDDWSKVEALLMLSVVVPQ
jgi:hypothetical protein